MYFKITYIKKLSIQSLILLFILFYSELAFSQTHSMSPKDCHEMTVWSFELNSCRPLAMAEMPMSMWMIHGNAFLVQNFAEGPRGRNQFSVPHMLMGDIGSSFGDRHYINVNLMMTFEKWSFPKKGYPELLQIGEVDEDGNPYIDGQHPHSSPFMGVTFSDTISLGGKDHIKLFFAPRGQATEGPVAFMHRTTGMNNPDAPLGHHIGQDVSHITSTVLGTSLHLGRSTMEFSVFNGTEPEPTEVDLPIGKLNSFGGRFIFEFTDKMYAMASVAHVKNPEPHDGSLDKIYRYSSSLYYDHHFFEGVMFHNTFIFGLVNYYDHIKKLRSFGDEFLIHAMDLPHNVWGRLEVLERGAEQLKIFGSEEVRWVSALTMGYTYDLLDLKFGKLGIGASLTSNFTPTSFEDAYGRDPIAGKIFVQLMGMKMGAFETGR